LHRAWCPHCGKVTELAAPLGNRVIVCSHGRTNEAMLAARILAAPGPRQLEMLPRYHPLNAFVFPYDLTDSLAAWRGGT
jgi:hypothetical protein